MASYTDAPRQFTPYISTTPIEEMVKVGMFKQQKYDEGVQKIQSAIYNQMALPLSRDVDKTYMQSLLNGVNEQLTGLVGADFSEQQIVNSTAGMVNKIGRDPNILAGVQSTRKIEENRKIMEEARAKGQLTPDNETFYNKRLSKYLQSTELGEKFSQNYIAHYDVDKHIKEIFDMAKPSGYSYDDVFAKNPDGSLKRDANGVPVYSMTMLRLEKEGVFPAEVKSILDRALSDPRVSQQLQITGEYNYRNFTPEQLAGQINKSRASIAASFDESLAELRKNQTLKKATQEDIDKLLEKKNNTLAYYDKLSSTALQNPEYVAGVLYEQDTRNQYMNILPWEKTKQEINENPGFKMSFELQKEANRIEERRQDKEWERQKFAKETELKLLEIQAKTLAGGRGGVRGKDGMPLLPEDLASSYTLADVSANYDKVQAFQNDYDKAAENYKFSSSQLVWEMYYSSDPSKQAELQKFMRSGTGLPKEQAIIKVLEQEAKNLKQPIDQFLAIKTKSAQNSLGTNPEVLNSSPLLNNLYNNQFIAEREFSLMNSAKKDWEDRKAKTASGAAIKALDEMNIPTTKATFNGVEYEVTKEDVIDLAYWKLGLGPENILVGNKETKNASKAAAARLKNRGKSALMDAYAASGYVTQDKPVGGTLAFWGQVFRNPSEVLSTGFSLVARNPFLPIAEGVYSVLSNTDYAASLQSGAEILDNIYSKAPNLKKSLLTGSAEENNAMKQRIKGIYGAYKEGQKQNIATNFKNFGQALSDKEASFSAETIVDETGVPVVVIKGYGGDASFKGDMVIQNDEALSLGIDVSNLYEPSSVSLLRTHIQKNPNSSTSNFNPAVKETYSVYNDAYFQKMDFPGMSNSKYDVKANIQYSNGSYYPFVYISEPGKEGQVYPLTGSPDLNNVINTMKSVINPGFAMRILQ